MRNSRLIKITVVVLTAAFLFGILHCFVLTFDAAFNYQVSVSLLKGKYATNYDHIVLFDQIVQTGAPVVFPTFFLNAIFGSSYVNMQIVCILYYLAFIYLLFFALGKKTDYYFAGLLVLIILLLPYVTYTSMVGYGEMVVALWMLLVMLFITGENRGSISLRYSLAGVCLGLGFLTKTVFLICIPSVFLLLVFEGIKSHETKKRIPIKPYILLIMFGLVTVLAFELFRLLQLGWHGYIPWWKEQLSAIFRQTGITKTSPTIADRWLKIKRHFNLYCSYYSLNGYLVGLLYLLPMISCLADLVKALKKRTVVNCDLPVMFLYSTAAVFLIWWLFIIPTEKTFYRRVIIGHVFAVTAFALTAYRYLKFFLQNHRTVKLLSYSFFLLFVALLCVRNGMNFYHRIESEKAIKADTVAVTEYLDDHPGQQVYGCTWWQAPVVSSFSNKVFLNIDDQPAEPNSLFIVDQYMRAGEPGAFDARVASRYNCKSVYQNQTYQVYQINPKENDCFSESDHMARFDIQSETKSIDVFYDTGSGFSESQKSTLSLFGNDYYVLEVPYDLDLLRIDFMTADTSVEISEIFVRINEDEYLLNGPELQLLIAGYHSISSPELDGDSLIFECVGPDPYIVFDVP